MRPVARNSMGCCWCQGGIGDICLAPVADCSAETLLVVIKACILPGTTIISYCCGYNVRLRSDGLKPLHQLLCEFPDTWMLTNTIKPTWMHVKVNLRPYWENDVKCVINGFKVSVSWVWWCCRINCKVLFILPFCWTIYSIYLSNWIYPWYPKNNKNTNYLKNMQTVMQCVICCAQSTWNI